MASKTITNNKQRENDSCNVHCIYVYNAAASVAAVVETIGAWYMCL